MLDAARWNAIAHLVSLAWLRAMTVAVMTVKSFMQVMSAQRYTPTFLLG
jgi:hypothetical protein